MPIATARCLEMEIEHGSAQDLYPCPVGGSSAALDMACISAKCL